MRAATAVLESFLKSQEITESIAGRQITVIGLRGTPGRISYLTLHEALDRGLVDVEELDEAGSVPECRVRNRSDERLLIFEGEELRGAKQNRVVNLSMLLEPGSETVVPVSCVEQDRWHYRSKRFDRGGKAPARLTYRLKKSVTMSLQQTQSYTSDQSAVWSEVDACLELSGSLSQTRCLSDAYTANQEQLDRFADDFRDLGDCSGFAVFEGQRLVSCELFDCPATFERLKDQVLNSLAFDRLFLGKEAAEEQSGLPNVYACLEQVAEEQGQAFASIGLGQTVRIEHGDLAATALVVDDEVLHFSLQRG